MRTLLLLAVCAVLATGACTDGTATAPAGTIAVRGTVLELRDDFPLDGGAELLLGGSDAATTRAYLPPLFTAPPPDSTRLATTRRVMAVFHELAVGDRVEARGFPTGDGLLLESLRRLP